MTRTFNQALSEARLQQWRNEYSMRKTRAKRWTLYGALALLNVFLIAQIVTNNFTNI